MREEELSVRGRQLVAAWYDKYEIIFNLWLRGQVPIEKFGPKKANTTAGQGVHVRSEMIVHQRRIEECIRRTAQK